MGSMTKLGLAAVAVFAARKFVFGPSQIKAGVAYPRPIERMSSVTRIRMIDCHC